ncbi:ACT domain-containing protein [Lentzea sp. NEAU-D13]|jgi:acetolactate synthase small subunit|uniref:acetolactate synthase n=1 Tax=Lentzea alba TaxID=2714351 RepID=A0A7C9RTY9_9PSEU|nr:MULTISPECIES: ACT domain-containing protein [Lentzea]NGY62788.1 ACT domain-containing protein [Lentzea alba]
MTRHALSMVLSNVPGALARVVVLFSTRGVDVESLSLDPTERGDVSRMDVVVGLPAGRSPDQLVKQLSRLVDVKSVVAVADPARDQIGA